MMNGWDMTGWGWGWMALWTVVALVLVAAFVAALVRASSPPSSGRADDSALAVLRRRFAAGEIDEAEYQQRRARLEG